MVKNSPGQPTRWHKGKRFVLQIPTTVRNRGSQINGTSHHTSAVGVPIRSSSHSSFPGDKFIQRTADRERVWHARRQINLLEKPVCTDYPTVGGTEYTLGKEVSQDDLYAEAANAYGSSLDRLARAYEADPETRRDLLQDIHLQLWRSFGYFDRRCSLRTWVYRVAHCVATNHVIRQRRTRKRLISIEEIETMPSSGQGELVADRNKALERLSRLIQQLKPPDRQIIVSYLEGMDAASTAEITGISSANVAMKVHRIKNILRRWFHGGESDAG